MLELIDEIESLSEEPLTKGITRTRDILKRQIEKRNKSITDIL